MTKGFYLLHSIPFSIRTTKTALSKRASKVGSSLWQNNLLALVMLDEETNITGEKRHDDLKGMLPHTLFT